MTFFVNVKQWRERDWEGETHTHTHSLLGKIFVHLRHEKSSHSAAGLNTVIWRSLSLPRAGKCHCVPDTQILGNQVNPSFFRREPNSSVEQWWNCSSHNFLAAHHLLRWLWTGTAGLDQSWDPAQHSLLEIRPRGHGISHSSLQHLLLLVEGAGGSIIPHPAEPPAGSRGTE